MNIYIFKGNNDTYGFVPTKESETLPNTHAPWKFYKEITLGGKPRIAVDESDIEQGIARDGYFIASASVIFTENPPSE